MRDGFSVLIRSRMLLAFDFAVLGREEADCERE